MALGSTVNCLFLLVWLVHFQWSFSLRMNLKVIVSESFQQIVDLGTFLMLVFNVETWD